jgi:hypothetical protein
MTSFTMSHGGRSSLDGSMLESALLKKGWEADDMVLVYRPCLVTISWSEVSASLISAFCPIDGVLPTAFSKNSRANSDCRLSVVSPSNVAGVGTLFGSEPDCWLRVGRSWDLVLLL